jgi:hypothetical protein
MTMRKQLRQTRLWNGRAEPLALPLAASLFSDRR